MSKRPESGRPAAKTAAAAAAVPPATTIISTAGGGGRMPGDERRQQIVNIAMRLFSERGFRGTTTKEIAQAAGVSEAIIFRHFATKEDLYTAIIDHKACSTESANAAQTLSDVVACVVADAIRSKDDRAVFQGIALAMMRHHESDPDFLRLLLYSALEGHQLAQIFWDRNVRRMYEFLGGYIRERQRDGSFRDIDPTIVARVFLGMIIHHSLNNILWDKSRRLLKISNEEAAHEFTDVLLRGITAAAAAAPGSIPAAAATLPKRAKKKK